MSLRIHYESHMSRVGSDNDNVTLLFLARLYRGTELDESFVEPLHTSFHIPWIQPIILRTYVDIVGLFVDLSDEPETPMGCLVSSANKWSIVPRHG